MIHFRSIERIIGALLLIEALILLGCSAIPLVLKETDFFAFLASALATACAGMILVTLGKKKGKENMVSRRDGYVVVSLSWIMFSLFGALPFMLSGTLTNFTDAFFETLSGFTTTGASVIPDMDSLPHGLLFWRSFTEWIGGLGIVFFTVVVLPIFGVGDVQLFAAEAVGPTRAKLHPRISTSGRWILTVYVVLTIACTIALKVSGLGLFDSINHSLCTIATGGGYTHNGGIEGIHSALAEYIIMVFMFLSGINFSLLYLALFKGKFGNLLHDTEFAWYAITCLIFIATIAIGLFARTDYGIEESLRHSAFHVISMVTTTGYVTTDLTLWPQSLWMLLGFCMFLGACAGSTTGAMKSVRSLVLVKIMRNEFDRILHPNAILPVRMNGKVLSQSTRQSILSFSMFFVGIIFVSWLLFMALGLDMDVAYGTAVASVCNVGLGVGGMGLTISWAMLPVVGKWLAAALMLIGRLEIFAVLILLTPGFWKHH